MLKTQTPDTIDSIIAENAWLHQRLDMQQTIQAGTNAEILRLNEANNSLRRIVTYFLMQHDGSYRILHKTLIAGERFVGAMGLEIDPITNDWLISITDKE